MSDISSTKTSTRIGILVGAGVFLLSSLATTGFVIWELSRGDTTASTTDTTVDSTAGKKLENYEPVAAIPALEKIDTTVGDGAEVKATDTVTVLYTGAIASTGVIFESNSDGQPATFGLDGVIKGWTDGIPGMKIGGTRRLMIPAEQAYGAMGSGEKIPPNTDLVFDVTVLSVGAAQ